MTAAKLQSFVLLLSYGFYLVAPFLHHELAAASTPCRKFHSGDMSVVVFVRGCGEDCDDPSHHHHAKHDQHTCWMCKSLEANSASVNRTARAVPDPRVALTQASPSVLRSMAGSVDAKSIRGPPPVSSAV